MKTIDYETARLMAKKIILSTKDINTLLKNTGVTKQVTKLILRDSYKTLLPKAVFKIIKYKHPTVKVKKTYVFSFPNNKKITEISIS